ncbi:MAG: hypothetical protein M1820_009332 [Bogoriella megaspora]|nr:MAG: hypothetical protein M1820_009332 [Bogoriella megaspora]
MGLIQEAKEDRLCSRMPGNGGQMQQERKEAFWVALQQTSEADVAAEMDVSRSDGSASSSGALHGFGLGVDSNSAVGKDKEAKRRGRKDRWRGRREWYECRHTQMANPSRSKAVEQRKRGQRRLREVEEVEGTGKDASKELGWNKERPRSG